MIDFPAVVVSWASATATVAEGDSGTTTLDVTIVRSLPSEGEDPSIAQQTVDVASSDGMYTNIVWSLRQKQMP